MPFFLSSGEIGISEKIEATGERVHGGVLVQCIDIEAQSAKGIGIFEDLRCCNNGNEFSTILTERVSKYYGTAARFFTEGIVKIDESTIRNTFREFCKLNNITPRYLSGLLQLNNLSPKLKRMVMEGYQPKHLSIQDIITKSMPVLWMKQEIVL